MHKARLECAKVEERDRRSGKEAGRVLNRVKRVAESGESKSAWGRRKGEDAWVVGVAGEVEA